MTREKCINGDGPVVMVDDDDVDAMMARRSHTRAETSYELLRFESGRSFLTYLDVVDAGKATMPRTVLLDISMPGLDGFEVLAAIKERNAFATDLPVIMMSHSRLQRDRDEAINLGATCYFAKPDSIAEYTEFFAHLAN